MATMVTPAVTAMQAEAEASLFLTDRLPDRISASSPHLDESAHVWRVPVVLTYPFIGTLGQIGEVVVGATKAEVISSTPVDEMLESARSLAEKHRDAIEAPLP